MCDVNIATGEVTHFEFDVLLSGRMPFRLTRSYSSENTQRGTLGCGWKLNLGTYLRCDSNQIELMVDGESVTTLPVIAIGQKHGELPGFEIERTFQAISIRNGEHERFTFPCNREVLPKVVLCTLRSDFYGNSITYSYDKNGLLTRLVDTYARRVHFSYDAAHRLTSVWLPVENSTRHRHLVRYVYNDHEDLVSVLDANGKATHYEYASHLLTRVTDRCGRDLFYQYDRERKCVRTWFSGGVWDRQLRFDAKTSRVMVTDPYGNAIVYKHNGKGTVVGEVDPLGRQRIDVVDDNGRVLLRSGDGEGTQNVIHREEGSATVLLSQNGCETTFALDEQDRIVRMIDHEGHVWKYGYDEAGNDVFSETPDGAVWTFDYNEKGDLVRAVDPVGYERRRTSTATQLQLKDAWGVKWDERFDELGRPVKYTDGLGGEIVIVYDPCGNPIQRMNPDGTTAYIQYDAEGNPCELKDELGRVLRIGRDSIETWIKFVRPDGREELFEYGRMDEFKRITNAKQETAEFAYDASLRCIRMGYFDGRQHSIVYDDADNPIALLDGQTKDVLIECVYENDELTEEIYRDGRRLSIGYGPSGEILSVENDDASLLFERDIYKRITKAHRDGFSITYAYNRRGECTSLRTNHGRRIDYEWDGRGRLVTMSDSTTLPYEYAYDVRDLITQIRMPNSCTQHFTYDEMHRMVGRRVTRPDGTEICSRKFVYDAAGRMIRYDDSLRGTRRYEYDAMDFLVSVDDNGTVTRFQYDACGNLLNTDNGETIAYEAGDRASQVGDERFEYDGQGNLIARGAVGAESRFAYTGEGWLQRADMADGTTALYEYDGMARRTSKMVDGEHTQYFWNGVHLLSECCRGKTTEYLFMPGSFFVAGVTHGDEHYSYVFDQLGTPTELIDASGQIVWAADYSAYGGITLLRENEVPQPFRFLGQYYDDELDWHYNRFRYYQPMTGQFTCADPLGYAAGLNLYSYAPNPVNWTDPLGLALGTPGAGQSATCEVMSMCRWGPEMMKEAEKKAEGTNEDCQPNLDKPCERPADQKDFLFKNCVDDDKKAAMTATLKSQGDSCKSKQVDHIKEVQCGGGNECKNLAPLTQTVNASFGSQIKTCRNQLIQQGMTGIVKMSIKLVDIRNASAEQLANHRRKPCSSSQTKCP